MQYISPSSLSAFRSSSVKSSCNIKTLSQSNNMKKIHQLEGDKQQWALSPSTIWLHAVERTITSWSKITISRQLAIHLQSIRENMRMREWGSFVSSFVPIQSIKFYSQFWQIISTTFCYRATVAVWRVQWLLLLFVVVAAAAVVAMVTDALQTAIELSYRLVFFFMCFRSMAGQDGCLLRLDVHRNSVRHFIDVI